MVKKRNSSLCGLLQLFKYNLNSVPTLFICHALKLGMFDMETGVSPTDSFIRGFITFVVNNRLFP